MTFRAFLPIVFLQQQGRPQMSETSKHCPEVASLQEQLAALKNELSDKDETIQWLREQRATMGKSLAEAAEIIRAFESRIELPHLVQ